ncbi:MAG: FAD:protein FMN transferase [Pirellulales bacterium]|nr:FAD:protein FMN transferase [Pirellulales bacterium]
MGTKFTLIFYAEDAEAANTAAQAAFARIAALNVILSDYDERSELSRLSSGSPHAQPVPVSDELWQVLTHAQQLAKRTQGAFDVTVGPIVRLWRRVRRQHKLPPQERLMVALRSTGYQHLYLSDDHQMVQLVHPGMKLDLGGIAKGYAADEAITVLREHGFTRALVDAGGDIVVGDAPPDQEGWQIEIAAPRSENTAVDEPRRYIHLANAAVAQSGDTWQFVEIDGVRYSHIVDPHTGVGLMNQLAVTVVAPDGITADSLASALSVMGAEKGLCLIAKLDDTEALLVERPDRDETAREVTSQGWRTLEKSDELPVVQ